MGYTTEMVWIAGTGTVRGGGGRAQQAGRALCARCEGRRSMIAPHYIRDIVHILIASIAHAPETCSRAQRPLSEWTEPALRRSASPQLHHGAS